MEKKFQKNLKLCCLIKESYKAKKINEVMDGKAQSDKKDNLESSLDWIPVDSDEECIPRRRKISSSSSSSSAEETSSEISTSNCETNNRYSSTNDLDSSFLKYEKQNSSQDETATSILPEGPSGEGKVRGWQKEPLSIMWCLNSFDAESSSQSRNVLYDQKTQTVMAVENPSQSSAPVPGNSNPESTEGKKQIKFFYQKIFCSRN